MLSEKQILSQAHKRFDEAKAHWGNYHQRCNEIFEFISGEQWTQMGKQAYENAGFAAMTSNRLPTFLRQITNELIKNTPEIQIDPHDDTEEEVATLRNDLIRGIQEQSNAKVAYCKSAEHAASVGIGYFRIITKFKDSKSMNKIIAIEKISDPNLVMLDPHHEGLCGEDSEYGFIISVLSHDEYRQKYSKTRLGRILNKTETEEDLNFLLKDANWSGADNKWTDTNEVMILEYYFKDYERKTLYEIYDYESGKTFTTYEKDDNAIESGIHEILQSRQIDLPVIRWCKLNDVEVLEKTEWPGEYIPIIAVKADEYWLKGKRKLVGAAEPAMEAQRELNYAKSWRGQLLQMAPKAPYIGTANQFKNFEQQWADINISNQAFIPYNKEEGAPPPQRDTSEIPIQGASLLVQQAQEDLQKIFGTFDPDQKNDAVESGKAILARQHQSFNSNYHFYESLARAIMHAGVIINQAIPVVYDTARTVQVLAQDGKKRSVQLNTPDEYGVIKYDMSVGDFTVSIQTGPSFGTKRQEMANSIMELIGVYPESAAAIADIAVRSMDWAGAQQIADSLEALVPPQVLQARKTDPKQAAAMVPQLKAQLAQAQQQIQTLGVQHQQMAAKLNEAATDIKVEQMKADVEIKKAELLAVSKDKELNQEAQKIELEFLIKEQELKIAMAELELEKEKLALSGVKAMGEIVDKHHDKTVDHLDRIHIIDASQDNTPGIGNQLDNTGSDNAGFSGNTLE